MTALSGHFEAESERGRRRLEDTIAPYTRFVRSESERLAAEREALTALSDRVGEMTARVDALAAG
jgi:hypothetical protein